MTSTLSSPPHTPGGRALLFACLTAAGVVGNWLQLPVLPDLGFGVGSAFSLLALHFLGIGWGSIAAAVIEGLSHLSLLPLTVGVMVLEVVVVGLFARRRRIGMVLADIVFWVSFGIPLLYFLYHQVHPSEHFCLVRAGRQGINSIANAVLARCLLTGLHLSRDHTLVPLRDLTFNMLAVYILAPAIALIGLFSRLPATAGLLHKTEEMLALLLVVLVSVEMTAAILNRRFVALLEQFSEPLPEDWLARDEEVAWRETRVQEAHNLMQDYWLTVQSHRSLYQQFNQLTESLEERITERTRDLAEHEAFTLDIVDSLQSSIAVLDSHGTIILVNQPWRDFARDNGAPGTAAAFLGDNYLEVCRRSASLGDGPAAAALAGILAVLARERDQFCLEYPCHPPQEKRWFVLLVTRLTGRRDGVVVTHIDITRRKIAEEALLDSEQKHRLLFDYAGDAILVSEPRGRVLAANPQACERLMYSCEQLLSMTLEQLHPPQHQEYWPERLHQLAERGHLLYETRHLCNDSTTVPTEVSARMVTWNGEPALLSICRDLTERKQLEEEIYKALETAQCASTKMKRLLRTVSHEFRTPLGLLTCGVDILDRYWEKLQPEARLQHHETIRNATQQLTALVSSVIEFNRTEASPGQGVRLVDLGDISHGVASDVATVWGGAHAFEVSIGECGPAMLDESLFRRVLENLLTNAFRFTPAGGKVSLQVVREGDLLRLEITDSGIGIPEVDHDRVFEAFYRSHNVEGRRGLGLGLSIVKEALTGMGGAIKVRSEARAGCTMTVEIPLQS